MTTKKCDYSKDCVNYNTNKCDDCEKADKNSHILDFFEEKNNI